MDGKKDCIYITQPIMKLNILYKEIIKLLKVRFYLSSF